MLKAENTYVAGIQQAIKGMRYPKQSWDKGDTTSDEIGPKDLKLAQHLVFCGTDHGKFMRQICVWVDITAPIFWWKEMDTYKIGTSSNSESTMHTVMDKEFVESDFSFNHISGDGRKVDMISELLYNLNELRYDFLELKEEKRHDEASEVWRTLIEFLPSSYNQKRGFSCNYQVLRNIYHARKNHKLSEWQDFRAWIETLPYSQLITAE